MQPHSFSWVDPLSLAAAFPDEPLVLLYSGAQTHYSGNISLLAVGLEEDITTKNFTPLAARLTRNQPPFANAWFGYLGYGLRCALEHITPLAPSVIDLPLLWMGRFRYIFRFDHTSHTLACFSPSPPPVAARTPIDAVPPITSLASNMTKAEYLAHVQRIVQQVHAGALYQANLTRKKSYFCAYF